MRELEQLEFLRDGRHRGCARLRAEDVRACLRAGTDPNARGEDGWTSLHDAAFKGHAGAIAALLEAGADPNARTETLAGLLALPG